MKIVWIIDSHKSALGINARSRATSGNFIVLAAFDFPSISSFIRALLLSDADLIIFSWRYLPLELISNKKYFKFWSTNTKIRFGYLVADFLFSEKESMHKEFLLQSISDFILGTTNEIVTCYTRKFPHVSTIKVFHDLPDYESIASLREQALLKPEKLNPNFIWVGNSQWGSRQNRKDHKGYEEIIIPLSKVLSSKYPESTFKIFDSNRKHRDQDEILHGILESDILFMASKSEGTGLPVLEAMGLGTVPISTHTGIAAEILSSSCPELLTDRNVDSFFHSVEVALGDLSAIKKKIYSEYQNHIKKVKSEFIDFVPMTRQTECNLRFSVLERLKIVIKWKIRYLRERSII